MRIVTAFLLAILVSAGCAESAAIGRGQQHHWRGSKAMQAGENEACVAAMTAAIAEYAPHLDAKPGGSKKVKYEIAFSYYGRGRCHQALAKHAEALADFEKTLALQNELCHQPQGVDLCREAADSMERAAVSRKALDVQEKTP